MRRRLVSTFAVFSFTVTALITLAPPAAAGPLDPFCYYVGHPWSGTGTYVCTPWD